MERYGLASYDAAHTAIVFATETHDLVTLDVGFSAVPASMLTLHVHGPAVRRVRELRSR
jgi:hypothetical protein